MANTVIAGESILYQLGNKEINRGEIILFKLPRDQKITYMQRVIGMPGETIQLHGDRVFINGKELFEARTYITNIESKLNTSFPEARSEGSGSYRVFPFIKSADESVDLPFNLLAVNEPYQIPQGNYFVMGDCRDNSQDSRYWGTVPRELVVGRVIALIDSPIPGRKTLLLRRLD